MIIHVSTRICICLFVYIYSLIYIYIYVSISISNYIYIYICISFDFGGARLRKKWEGLLGLFKQNAQFVKLKHPEVESLNAPANCWQVFLAWLSPLKRLITHTIPTSLSDVT